MDINTFLSNNFPIITAIVGTIIIVTPVIWRIAKYYHSLQNTKKKVEGLPCEIHDNDISDIKSDFNVLKKDFVYVKSDIGELKTGFIRLNDKIDYLLPKTYIATQKQSPLSLTALGEQIEKEFNFKEIVDVNWSKINEQLKNINLKHPYDIEQYCLKTTFGNTENFLSEADIIKLKNIAFKGTHSLIQLTDVISVLILERYFAENNIDTTF